MSGKPKYTRHHRHCIFTAQDPATCEECARWRKREAIASRQRRVARNGGRVFKKVTTELAPREYNMRIPEVLRDRLRQVAAQNYMSMNALMVRALSDRYLDPRTTECNDPMCGCMEPTFTDPYSALVFLAGRMEFAGVSDLVARSYARDIRAMMKDVVRITIDKVSIDGCTMSIGGSAPVPEGMPTPSSVRIVSSETTEGIQ